MVRCISNNFLLHSRILNYWIFEMFSNKYLMWQYIFIIALVAVIIIYLAMVENNKQNMENIKNKESFLVKMDPKNDGKMRFGYLTNPNYANMILMRYYVNDDKKIGGIRLVSHPYQKRNSPNGRDKYYGSLYWDKTRSDNVYKITGIRL